MSQVSHSTIKSPNVPVVGLQEVRQVVDHETTQAIQVTLLTIPQVARLLCLSRAKVYLLISNEGLPVVRFGRAMRVSPTSLKQWLQQREQGLIA